LLHLEDEIVNPQDLLHLDETREIVEAVRQIRDDRSILETARENLGGALDRLNLSANARTVVTPLLTAALTIAASGPMINHISTHPAAWG
jgi:hypothetical protein